MSGESVFRVEIAGICRVRIVQSLGETFLCFWNADEMNVVCHQRVTPNAHVVLDTGFLHYADVNKEVRLIVEKRFFTHASLSDVVCVVRNNASKL